MSDVLDSYPGRCGEELDRFLNVVVLNGQVGETISLHAARDAEKRERWACLLCAWLSRTVETDHCPRTLAGQSISPRGGIIAGLQLLAVFLLLTGGLWWLVLR